MNKDLLPEKIQEQITTSGINDLNLAESIASNFSPFLVEITDETDKLKGLELGNEEHVEIARRVNINLGKIRSRKNETKKEQKDYYLKVGKFIDSLANVNEGLITLGQEEAQKHSKYFDRMEAERIQKLKEERNALMEPYSDFEIPNIELYSPEAFDKMLENYKLAHESRIKAEKEAEEARIEAEKKEKELDDRIVKRNEELRPYFPFMGQETPNFRLMSEEDYQETLSNLKKAKSDHEAEQERIRAENERLKKEAEKKAEAEEIKKAEEKSLKEKSERRNKAGIARQEILHEIGVNLDFNSCADMKESVWIQFFEDKNKEYQKEQNKIFLQKENESREAAKKQAELDLVQKELQAEKDRQAKIKADQEAEEKRKADEEAELLKSGDKNRMNAWVDSMLIKGLPGEGLSDEAIKISNEIFSKFSLFKDWAKKEIEKL